MKQLQRDIHQLNIAKGFWESGHTSPAEKLLLIHAEVAEATEVLRIGIATDSDKLPGIGQFYEELADIVIRTLDLAEFLGADLGAVIQAKLEYNRTRPYKHNKEF